ncbi:TIGR04211 family SH3 domain-containing protein [Thalassotalea euphylliae]|uniref:TIGR04211 family SH3 domain-containing protein n=1 Tax=Thalassotalea euphylliae TaxID=1655234 RepID=UPI00362DBD35
MRKLAHLLALALASISIQAGAQEAEANFDDGFISDELFIYMHAGAGTNYRIVGSITAGTQVKLTGEARNEYTQIIDDKDRTAWVESKFVSTKPGLRHVVAELNGQLATTNERESSLQSQISTSNNELANANANVERLSNELATLKKDLASAEAKVASHDMDIKKEWFFNGAIVMCIGILLGILLPKLGGRKKSSMDSWT